jgi:hypothetical protein
MPLPSPCGAPWLARLEVAVITSNRPHQGALYVHSPRSGGAFFIGPAPSTRYTGGNVPPGFPVAVVGAAHPLLCTALAPAALTGLRSESPHGYRRGKIR